MGTRAPLREKLLTPDGSPFDFALQDGASTAQELSAQTPFFDGAGATQWIGFGAVVSIFLIFIIAVIRARVIKPAERMARETDFFEPAGAHAEITFDTPTQSSDAASSNKDRRNKKADKKNKPKDRDDLTDLFPADAGETPPADNAVLEEVVAEPVDEDAEHAPGAQMAEIAAAIDNAATEDENPSPFAGLFTRNDDAAPNQPDQPAREDEDSDDNIGADANAGADETIILAAPYEDASGPNDVRIDHLPEIDQDYWDSERERRETEAYNQAAEERRLALDAADQARAAAQADRREAVRMQRNADAALEQRMQAMAAMQGKLDAMADRLARDADSVETRVSAVLEEKFAALSDDMHQRLHTAAVDIDAHLQNAESVHSANAMETQDSAAAAAAIASHVMALQNTMESALTSLAERIDALGARPTADPAAPEDLRRLNALLAERAAPAVAGTLQLNDLVRAALPSGRYGFDHALASGAKADCIISRAGASDFAIDARFPAEAFDRYARADEKNRDHAATAYRRAVLRHMIFVAEKFIVPGETADFAILFVPNDTIFSDLHQNFADVVQDSYRARIWIASPTSLMAMLHMMNAASHTDDGGATRRDDAVLGAVAALSARISALEENLERVNAAPTAPTPLPRDATRDDDRSASAAEKTAEPAVLDMYEADIASPAEDASPTKAVEPTDDMDGEGANDGAGEGDRDGDTMGHSGRSPFPLR